MPPVPPVPQTVDVLAEQVAQRCRQARWLGTSWEACCPAHDDTTPSLSITPSTEKILLHCFAGCSLDAIVAALDLTVPDLFLHPQPSVNGAQIVATYCYVDLTGQMLHETVRYAPKAFKQRRPDPVTPGAYVWNLKGIEPVLYHLPTVLAAIQQGETIYVVEGEKDADALQALGLVATCNPMGAGKWRPGYSATLRGAHCVLLPDNDAPGRKHAEQVARALDGIAASVLVVALPDLPPQGDVSDWLAAGGTRDALETLVTSTAQGIATPRPVTPHVGWSANGALDHAAQWRIQKTHLATNKNGVICNYFNVAHILKYHPYWHEEENLLWFDSIRGRHMCGTQLITKKVLVNISLWFGSEAHKADRLHMTKLDILKDCLYERCEEDPRDLLQHWLHSLPPWDHIPRLDTWLRAIAEVEDTAYGQDISRLLPVAMVARALNPGCPYRYVVVLEGPENSGKSSLVRMLASPEWYYAMKSDFESKEAHMEIQGAWLAELPELDSLNRTGETRLKAFITLLDDSWIPKYANERTSVQRRTIFVGTINPEEPYLKGQTGNTRFAPIQTGTIHHQALAEIRDQLFAEAYVYFQAHPTDWWEFSPEGQATLDAMRESRRMATPFEDLLQTWLLTPLPDTFPPQLRTMTTWQEIAEQVLKIETPERWKDKVLQMDISRAMRALGWQHVKRRATPGSPPRWVWDCPEGWGVPF